MKARKHINLIIVLLTFAVLWLSLDRFFGINIFSENLLIDNYITYIIILLFGVFGSTNKSDGKNRLYYAFSILLSAYIGNLLGFNFIVQGISFSLGFLILGVFILNEYKIINLKYKNIDFSFMLVIIYAFTSGLILHALFIILSFFVGRFISKYLNSNKLFNFIKLLSIFALTFIVLNRIVWTLKSEECIDYKNNIHSIITSEYQYVKVDLKDLSKEDIILQKSITFKFIITASKVDLIRYGNRIVINEYGVNEKLKEGDNVIEFIPNDTKTTNYSIWMNMKKRKIKVIDAINCFINEEAVCNSKC